MKRFTLKKLTFESLVDAALEQMPAEEPGFKEIYQYADEVWDQASKNNPLSALTDKTTFIEFKSAIRAAINTCGCSDALKKVFTAAIEESNTIAQLANAFNKIRRN